jgi:hypothetical protein
MDLHGFEVDVALCRGLMYKRRYASIVSFTPTLHLPVKYGATHHVARHDTPIHNILSTAPQLSISQKALGTLPENGNVMPKHVGATIHN